MTSTKKRTELTGVSRVRSSALLACGHPSRPNNLRDGKCGTCRTASEMEQMAEREGGKLAEALNSLVKILRKGDVVYDRKGKSLLEWEKFFKARKQANEKAQAQPPESDRDRSK